ncbi:aldose epimerase family protein [Priestia koreensis]|uniref:aldose epimerase family protein n=1 Tax=Priestia koreensis TaxID=284581 RepID=UPI0028F6ECFE|nr:aldose epimerase family protein [Priestia koreensis]
MKIDQTLFGTLDGNEVHAYTLTNNKGVSVTCLDYGCVIQKLIMPNREGKGENIVLGFDHIDDYVEHSPYFGAIVGPVAGRIKAGEFELNGKPYHLAKNDGENHIHGGIKGFSHVIWRAELTEGEDEVSVRFLHYASDGEDGYPGNVRMSVTYTLTEEELSLSYEGTSDKDTILNVTNHTYFNLSGDVSRDVLDHTVQIPSDSFLELNEESLPTGHFLQVEGTPFDFRQSRKLKDGALSDHPQTVLVGNGYDHPFFLKDQHQPIILSDEESGRQITVSTDQVGVVLYTSNQLKGNFEIQGVKARPYLGVCLETQGLPDAIHHSDFPSIVVKENELYQAKTTYKFTSLI